MRPSIFRQSALAKWLPGLLGVAGVFILMARWSWRKWADVLVDFGEQLYAPWQIGQGKVLYRDIGYAIGPLSQYGNALLFKIFGVSLSTLIGANLALLALSVVFIYWLLIRCADQITATAACAVILSVFAVSQYVGIGNYNFICPYSHEATHGLMLAILDVWLLCQCVRSTSRGWFAAAGFCCGLVFLTKPEIFVALLAATAAACFCGLSDRRSTAPAALSGAACFCLCALIPPAAFFVYFENVLHGSAGLAAVLGSWNVASAAPMVRSNFYKWCLGLDEPLANAGLMVFHFAGASCVILACALCSKRGAGVTASRRVTCWLLLLALAGVAAMLDWSECGRCLPLMMACVCVSLGRKWWRDSAARPALLLPLVWSVFALALLAKMGIHCRVWHYGFCLAMPAAVSVIYFLTWFLPRSIEKYGARPGVFRFSILLLVAIGAFRLVLVSNEFYRVKTYAIGLGGDRMMSLHPRLNARGWAVNQTLQWIDRNTAASATLSVIPEGIMINYLSRRSNPTPYTTLVPMASGNFDQGRVLNSFLEQRPDYIILFHKDTSEWGEKFFGHSPAYGLSLMQWINKSYRVAWQFGSEPLQDEKFGIKAMKRTD